eukprot:gene2351-1480_t
MAEAARTVKHYVSDCLEERHPYDVQKGFAGRGDRDRGKVFSGFLPGGIDDLVRSLSDASIGDPERAKAVHHLYAHSASQEMKIALLQKGVVTLIVQILRRRPFHLLEHQCLLLLRSLCTIPEGCFPVVDGGGVEMALMSLLNTENKEERQDARTAAAHVIYQVVFDFAGIRWLLRVDDCSEFKLRDADAEPAPFLMRIEDVMKGVKFVLDTEPMTSKIAIHSMCAMAQLTTIAPVLHFCVAAGEPLDTVAHLLCAASGAEEWRGAMGVFVCQLLITVHNIATDQKCVEALEQRGVPDMLFTVFERMGVSGETVLTYSIQRHLMAAISMVFKLTPTKLKASQPLGQYPSRVMALVHYLEQINDVVDDARRRAISKNTVQCIRMSTEVRPVREIMHQYIDAMARAEPTRCFYFRRQLYCTTQWEAEYEAAT